MLKYILYNELMWFCTMVGKFILLYFRIDCGTLKTKIIYLFLKMCLWSKLKPDPIRTETRVHDLVHGKADPVGTPDVFVP